ncbi:hypothetical protein [uncultured Pseudokineococcus sp.]|uniref:hypothetical protein n=1 Tax=uncultured Pseudokineococcus sp. TaxID=1642928 RepID=UPI00262B60AC|nr:hypothetical protein [uncultured Pseudokineococcus sp.]
MSGARQDHAREVRVDLDGIGRRYPVATGRGWPYLLSVVLLSLGAQVLVRAALDTAGLTAALLGGLALLVGGGGAALVGARAHLRLEPAGFRRHDGLRYGRRLRSWSTVREVRPSSRWNEHPELRGTRASDEPVVLVGMTDDDARELGRRLEAARSGKTSSVPAEADDGASSTSGARSPVPDGLVLDLGDLPQVLATPLGRPRSLVAWAVGAVVAVVVLAWTALSWALGDGPHLLPLVVGGVLLLQSCVRLLAGRRERVLLRPTGVVVAGDSDDRERPWTGSLRVRPPSRWASPPQLVGLPGGPVTLWGYDDEQARELRRRLEGARARAARDRVERPR